MPFSSKFWPALVKIFSHRVLQPSLDAGKQGKLYVVLFRLYNECYNESQQGVVDRVHPNLVFVHMAASHNL